MIDYDSQIQALEDQMTAIRRESDDRIAIIEKQQKEMRLNRFARQRAMWISEQEEVFGVPSKLITVADFVREDYPSKIKAGQCRAFYLEQWLDDKTIKEHPEYFADEMVSHTPPHSDGSLSLYDAHGNGNGMMLRYELVVFEMRGK